MLRFNSDPSHSFLNFLLVLTSVSILSHKKSQHRTVSGNVNLVLQSQMYFIMNLDIKVNAMFFPKLSSRRSKFVKYSRLLNKKLSFPLMRLKTLSIISATNPH